jgi:hypothetical protein
MYKKRGPRKHKADYGRMAMHTAYTKSTSELEKVGYSTYAKVLNEFNKAVVHEILQSAFEYIMPCRLGTLRIKKYKPTIKVLKNGSIKGKLKPDWKATKELWAKNEDAKKNKKLVYHTNDHSDGYEYKWHFSNYRSTCKNKSAYCFVPSRTNKRAITALVKDENFKGDYYE